MGSLNSNAAPPAPARTSLFAILELPDFRRLWLGQAVSQFGDALYMLLFSFMVERLTGDAGKVGLVMALQGLPFLLLSPLAGSVADRVDRRRIMVACDLASFVILVGFAAALAILHRPPDWMLLSVPCLLSVVNVFFLPAKSASIPRLVPTDRLMEANSLSMATQTFMPLIGIGLSGGLLGAVERLAPDSFFLVAVAANALSFLFSALYIVKLPPIIPEREAHEQKSAWREAWGGLAFLRDQPVLRMAAIQIFLLNFFISPFFVVYIAVNAEWFGGTFWRLAAFEIAFTGTMVIASLWLGKRKILRPGMAFLAGMLMVGLFVGAMAWSRNFWLFLFWNFICGFALPIAQLPMQNYFQVAVPDALRGRVQAVLAMIAASVLPIGAGLAGALLQRIGPEWMFMLMGAGMVVSCIWGYFDRPFREARMET